VFTVYFAHALTFAEHGRKHVVMVAGQWAQTLKAGYGLY
jgi:hypothetical protein